MMTNMNQVASIADKQTDVNVGRRVHMLMWDAQLTQTQLAPMLGIEQSAISKKLRGQRGWSLDEVVTAAEVLRTSVAYLVGETDVVRPEGFEPPTFCSVVDIADWRLATDVEVTA